MSEETLFSKIIRHEIPADIVWQDEWVTAFRDISPKAPVHVLIVPNKMLATLNDVGEEDERLLAKMITTATRIAKQEGIAEDGYRLVINCNPNGGQVIYHLHMHLLGGRPLRDMVGN